MPRTTGVLFLTAAMLSLALAQAAAAHVIGMMDQYSVEPPSPTATVNAVGYLDLSLPENHMGQEFVPQLPGIDSVEFDQWSPSVDSHVTIHLGSLAGPIVGTSLPLPPPTGTGVIVMHYDFPSMVPLVPGYLYTFELMSPGLAVFAFYLDQSGPGLAYPFGSAIIGNDIAPDLQADLMFREGLTPEPATLALLGLGVAGLVARRRNKK
ncbi:MAG: PEP-CTERM sorting domain-containing protein [Planctomycetota bacterium]|nr:PEP-CTERM sorting domain-containing protein [Planctomycetota bacterium]